MRLPDAASDKHSYYFVADFRHWSQKCISCPYSGTLTDAEMTFLNSKPLLKMRDSQIGVGGKDNEVWIDMESR